MSKDENRPAFPRPAVWNHNSSQVSQGHPGMTLRQYYAGLALQGYLSSFPGHQDPAELATSVGRDCWKLADGLLATENDGEQLVNDAACKAMDEHLQQDIDYTLKKGETVYSRTWGHGRLPVEVVDINWATRSGAFKLAVDGGIVVWPMAGMKREPFPELEDSAE